MPLRRSAGRLARPSSPRAKLLLLSGSSALVILTLAGAEGLARRWAPDYLARTRGLYVHSRTYGWVGRPGAVAPMGGGRITLDTRGYRGQPLAPRRSGWSHARDRAG